MFNVIFSRLVKIISNKPNLLVFWHSAEKHFFDSRSWYDIVLDVFERKPIFFRETAAYETVVARFHFPRSTGQESES